MPRSSQPADFEFNDEGATGAHKKCARALASIYITRIAIHDSWRISFLMPLRDKQFGQTRSQQCAVPQRMCQMTCLFMARNSSARIGSRRVIWGIYGQDRHNSVGTLIALTPFSSFRRHQDVFAVRAASSRKHLRRVINDEVAMLYWAAVFFVIAIVAAAFGFGGIAASSAGIAQILFIVFLILFLVSAIAGTLGRRGPPPI
jgi:uncharacterized membrane protein YtjA (UPF0391 family)